MGQYHYVVNLDKREYLDPHKMGCGLKLWEQIVNHPGTGTALVILLACSNGRGGGDLAVSPASDSIIGRWAGDRIAVVGDYAEDGDLAPEHCASGIYSLCGAESAAGALEGFRDEYREEFRAAIEGKQVYKDITDAVCAVIEAELEGKFSGEGWRTFVANENL